LTIVPSKSITGRINIFLNNLTFDDALEVILVSQDMASERKGTIISIMTSGEYERLYGRKFNEKREVRTLKVQYAKPSTVFSALSQIKSDIGKVIVDESSGTILLIDIPEKVKLMEATALELDVPLETEVFNLKYAKTADMKTHLSSAITAGPGELFVDERSSKIAVSDLPSKMRKIERLVRAFDEKSKQVFIEAEIVQVSLKDEYQQGLNLEALVKDTSWNGFSYKGAFPVAPSFTPSTALSSNTTMQVKVGTLPYDQYTSTLQFLQNYGNTKILSRPRIAVMNNQEAKIMVGSREAYTTSTTSQTSASSVVSESVQFIDVGIKLNVVPTINDDGFVTMKIKPEVSSVRETLKTPGNNIIPIVETSEAETMVKVKDGTMIMIAGLMKEERNSDSSGVPGLSRIPWIGGFFSSRASRKKKNEIIVFLTPHIMTGEVSVADAEPERHIPPEIMPSDMKKDIISQKVEEMRQKQLQSIAGPENQLLQHFPRLAEPKDEEVISDKTKDIKDL
jgi:type II secretory pathway component GspD/PulD (secretin)